MFKWFKKSKRLDFGFPFVIDAPTDESPELIRVKLETDCQKIAKGIDEARIASINTLTLEGLRELICNELLIREEQL